MLHPAKEQFNTAAQAVEEAQTEIREIVKRGFLKGYSLERVNAEVVKAIKKYTSRINIPRLQKDAERSLIGFANAQRIIWQSLGISPELLLFLGKQAAKDFKSNDLPSNEQLQQIRETAKFYRDIAYGVPLQEYYKTVWEKRVKPIFDKLVKNKPLDPNDFSGRNSLRNLAEMEVRYDEHQKNIADLKSAGHKLVVASSHADCSERCAKWQGRIYSLNGTAGKIDGYNYVPLEQATDIYYTTKAGRVYKNGLLGFNCRHYLMPYEGKLLPTVSAEEREKQYAITKQQRKYEAAIRTYKAKALYEKETNGKEYKAYLNEARKLNKEYIKFSKDNDRAYYPIRTELL